VRRSRLSIIRGEKQQRRAPLRAGYRRRPSAEPAATDRAKLPCRDVIPILEGWVRVIERQAVSLK
jgi:hypothetical protein